MPNPIDSSPNPSNFPEGIGPFSSQEQSTQNQQKIKASNVAQKALGEVASSAPTQPHSLSASEKEFFEKAKDRFVRFSSTSDLVDFIDLLRKKTNLTAKEFEEFEKELGTIIDSKISKCNETISSSTNQLNKDYKDPESYKAERQLLSEILDHAKAELKKVETLRKKISTVSWLFSQKSESNSTTQGVAKQTTSSAPTQPHSPSASKLTSATSSSSMSTQSPEEARKKLFDQAKTSFVQHSRTNYLTDFLSKNTNLSPEEIKDLGEISKLNKSKIEETEKKLLSFKNQISEIDKTNKNINKKLKKQQIYYESMSLYQPERATLEETIPLFEGELQKRTSLQKTLSKILSPSE